jgi:arsenate reductase
MAKKKIVFFCTGNSIRSQMAEAFVRNYAGDHFDVYSAGFEPRVVHPYTLKVMKELGYDLTGHNSKDVNQLIEKENFEIVITVCSDAEKRCPVIPGVKTKLHWPFEDPVPFIGTEEEKLARFREVRERIDERVKNWLKETGSLK